MIFYYGESPISWSTQKQATVALSSCESKFIAATAVATQALWLKRLLNKLTHSEEEKITIKVDNKFPIALMKNPVFHGRSKHIDTKYHFIRECAEREDIQVEFDPVFHERSKHIDIRYHFIRECVENGCINVEHVSVELQRADILTKALPRLNRNALSFSSSKKDNGLNKEACKRDSAQFVLRRSCKRLHQTSFVGQNFAGDIEEQISDLDDITLDEITGKLKAFKERIKLRKGGQVESHDNLLFAQGEHSGKGRRFKRRGISNFSRGNWQNDRNINNSQGGNSNHKGNSNKSKGKHSRTPFPNQAKFISKNPLELVYGDLCGPISRATHSGKKLIFLLVDDCTRFMWAYFLTSKDQAFSTFKEFRQQIEMEMRMKLRMLRTDRGGKHSRTPFSNQDKFRSKNPLDLVYRDLCGPISLATHSDKKFIFLLVDECTRFMWAYFLTSKDQALSTFKEFRQKIEMEMRMKVRMLRTDRGGEFTSNEFNKYCKENRIARQLTAPYSPQQNGVVERRNRTVLSTTRSMMKVMKLPLTFWAEAVRHAIYILNRVLTRTMEDKTPYEALYNRKPNMENLLIFGCTAYAKITTPHLKKLDDRSIPLIYLGVEEGSKACRPYNPITKKKHVSRDVKFMETKPWDWNKDEKDTSTQDTFWTSFVVEGLDNENATPIPMDLGTKLVKAEDGNSDDATYYRSLIGSLMYLLHTRLDLSYSVRLLSRLMQDPKDHHLKAVKQKLNWKSHVLTTYKTKSQLFSQTTQQTHARPEGSSPEGGKASNLIYQRNKGAWHNIQERRRLQDYRLQRQ
nr:zinc finger, CCHC-type [Tanacetum cinerariifolium]